MNTMALKEMGVQTIKKVKQKKHGTTIQREIQTRGIVKNRFCGKGEDVATQMSKEGIQIFSDGDKIMEPRHYISGEAVQPLKEKAAIKIQCCYRGFSERRRLMRYSDHPFFRRRVPCSCGHFSPCESTKHAKCFNATCSNQIYEGTDINFENDSSPQNTKVIFSSKIYLCSSNELPKRNSKEKLHSCSVNSKNVFLTKLEKQNCKRNTFLKSVSEPLQWPLSDGSVAVVKTPKMFQNMEWASLYYKLSENETASTIRLKTLQYLQDCVSVFPHKLSYQILELIEKEIFMINAGRPSKRLLGLRQRILNQLYYIIEDANKAVST